MTEPLDCTAAMRQLWDYLDEELDAERMAAIREHLHGCQRCWPHYDFERAFLTALNTSGAARVAPDELRRRVLGALKEEGFTGD